MASYNRSDLLPIKLLFDSHACGKIHAAMLDQLKIAWISHRHDKNPVCVIIWYSNRLGKVQIGHAGTAVFICFLLAWWMDQEWSTLFQAGLSTIW